MQWLNEYTGLVELVIRTYNRYGATINRADIYGTEEPISFAQMQTLEIIMKNPEANQAELARLLGVSRAAMTKSLKLLEGRGLVERHAREGNRKNIYLNVSEKGQRIYGQYVDYIKEALFDPILKLTADLSPADLKRSYEIFKLIDDFMD